MQWIAASLDGSPKDQGLLNIAFDAVCIYPVAFLPASLVVKEEYCSGSTESPWGFSGYSLSLVITALFFEEEKNVVHPYHFTIEEAWCPERLELHRKS